MKKIYLLSFILIVTILTGCNQTEEQSETKDVEKATVTQEDRDNYLNSHEYIEEFSNSTSENRPYLIVKFNEEFKKKSVSEQYLYLIDFYNNYGRNFNSVDSSNTIEFFFGENENPTYIVYPRVFEYIALNLNVDRNRGSESLSENTLNVLDTLDKKEIYSGITFDSLRNSSTISSNGEISGPLKSQVSESDESDEPETDVSELTGYEWVKFSNTKKFNAASNTLYTLKSQGYTVSEKPDYYVDALNEFYTDSSTMNSSIYNSILTIGKMSNTIAN